MGASYPLCAPTGSKSCSCSESHGNALKYRDPERPPRIRIAAETRDRTYRFAIADNGVGIDPKHHERIFAPLKRLDGKNIPGTGIGLAVCKKIIERHGGRIGVESQPGKGQSSNSLFSPTD
ncbi:MAG: sensor histidine kinase [Bryobacteraceae bacterium]